MSKKFLFVAYPKCSTCQKAAAWLRDNSIDFTCRHIVDNPPSASELKLWHKKSGLPLRRFFNTSGLVYKNLALKDKLPSMSEAEQYRLLAQNGMLVRRPLLIGEDVVLVGFHPEEWEKIKE